jgi:hypothetical protein
MANTTTYRVVRDPLGTWAVSCPAKGVYISGLGCIAAQLTAAQMNKDEQERSLVARSACAP